MPLCKSVTELIETYGENWQNMVTINSGPHITCPYCCPENGCSYYTSLYAGSDPGTFTVSNAGSYVVTAAFGESEPGANDGTQAGTYSMNGTYEYSYGYWNKQNCSGNDCFSIYVDNGSLTIYGQGPAGFPAWRFTGSFTEYNSPSPWTFSGWTKVTNNPSSIIINGSEPTVVKTEKINLVSLCKNAGGQYTHGGYYDPFYPATCLIYGPLPEGSDPNTMPPLPSPAPGGPIGEGMWDFIYNSAFQGTCCLGVCEPTIDCCNNPRNYATQVDWSQWRLKYNGQFIGPDMSTSQARASSNIDVSCATRWDDPGTPAYIVEVESFNAPICSFGQITFYTLSTVQLYGAVVAPNGDGIAPLLRYCNYNFYITADESLTPTAHLAGPGLLVSCPNSDTNAYGGDFSGCCSEVPGGPTCSPPTITFEHI